MEILFFILSLGLISFLVYSFRNDVDEQFMFGNNDRNSLFSETLIIFSYILIRQNNENAQQKIKYIKSFIQSDFYYFLTINRQKELIKYSFSENAIEKRCKSFKFQPHSLRLVMIFQLFKVAAISNSYTANENNIIAQIARELGITTKNFEIIRSKFFKDSTESSDSNHSFENQIILQPHLAHSFMVLGISSEATNMEIKKAYYSLAKLFHPDISAHLGDAKRNEAEARFKEINQAYEILKESRKMK